MLAAASGRACAVYLLVETAPRRPLHAPEDALGDKLADLATLDASERALVLGVIDAITTKAKLRLITTGAQLTEPVSPRAGTKTGRRYPKT
jgi:hypothetical protein